MDGEDFDSGNVGKHDTSAETVQWSASEYVAHQKNGQWYLGLLLGSALLIGFVYLITSNVISTIVVGLACLSIGIFAIRKPQTQQYRLTSDGVHIGQKFYSYHQFKSFALVDEDGLSSIWLRPLKRLMPTVNMYFAPDDEQEIVSMLDNFLPREDREHDAIDRLSRRFRF